MYLYRAKPVRVIDGDTIEVLVDLGFGLIMGTEKLPFRVRVLGVDTPELHSKEDDTRHKAVLAKEFTAHWIEVATVADKTGWPLVIETEKDDSFGRWLAKVSRVDGKVLSADLLAENHGVVRLKK